MISSTSMRRRIHGFDTRLQTDFGARWGVAVPIPGTVGAQLFNWIVELAVRVSLMYRVSRNCGTRICGLFLCHIVTLMIQ